MIKIDKTELFRVFVILEAALVGLPIIIFWSVAVVLCMVGYSLLGWLDADFALGALACIFAFYFLLPGLVAPGLFQGAVLGVLPKDVTGWLLVVGVHSILALLFALPASFYLALPNRKKSSAQHVAAPDCESQQGPSW